MYRIEIVRAMTDRTVLPSFWWRILGRNGQVVATSETYATRTNARRAARKFGKATGLKVVEP